MNNKEKSGKLAITPIITIAASIVVAACFYFSVYLILQSIYADVDNGTAGGMPDKLYNLNYIVIIGFSAIIIINTCIHIINYVSLVKPLRRLRIKDEQQTRSSKEVIAHTNALHKNMVESGNTAVQITQLSEGQSESIKDTHKALTAIAANTRQLFVSTASVDNTVAQLSKNINSVQTNIRGIIASAPGAIRAANAVSDSNSIGIYAANSAFEKFFTDAESFFEMLNQVSEFLSGKVDSCTAIIKDAAAQANLLSLNAAMETAKAGQAGRGFVYIAEDVRTYAENLRNVIFEIREAADHTQSQIVLISELVALHDSAKRKYMEAAEANGAQSAEADIWDNIAAAAIDDTALLGDTAFLGDTAQYGDTTPSGVTALSIDEATSSAIEPSGAAIEPSSAIEPSGDIAEDSFEQNFEKIRGELDAIRIAIRSIGAALAESYETVTSDINLFEQMTGANAKITDGSKTIASLLKQADEQIESIAINQRTVGEIPK